MIISKNYLNILIIYNLLIFNYILYLIAIFLNIILITLILNIDTKNIYYIKSYNKLLSDLMFNIKKIDIKNLK